MKNDVSSRAVSKPSALKKAGRSSRRQHAASQTAFQASLKLQTLKPPSWRARLAISNGPSGCTSIEQLEHIPLKTPVVKSVRFMKNVSQGKEQNGSQEIRSIFVVMGVL